MQKSTQSETSKRLNVSLLTKEQQKAVDFLYENNGILYARLGGGKTVIAATAITELLVSEELKRILIITTPKIANTVWTQEFDKWEHTHSTLIYAATGNEESRLHAILKMTYVKVIVITFAQLQWMKQNDLFKYFDGLLIDETTKLSESGGAGFKALRPSLKKFKWRVGLTGTPVNESYEKLFAQALLIDLGHALGTRKDKFLNTWFYPTDFKQYNWSIKPDKKEKLFKKVEHLFHLMPDYRSELPEFRVHKIELPMPEELKPYYDEMKTDFIVSDIIAATVAIKTQKLSQLINGFIYNEYKEPIIYSHYRLNALIELLEKLNDENVLIFYWYKEDLRVLKEAIPESIVLTEKTVPEWNTGNIKILLVQPRSAAHGLQLEQGGHTVIWYSNQWSNDIWEQANARVWRKGQKHPVDCYYFETQDSIDEIMNQRVESKQEFDRIFSEYLTK